MEGLKELGKYDMITKHMVHGSLKPLPFINFHISKAGPVDLPYPFAYENIIKSTGWHTIIALAVAILIKAPP